MAGLAAINLSEKEMSLEWVIEVDRNITRSSDTFGGPRHSCGGGKTNSRL
jgi:hypothetical protein